MVADKKQTSKPIYQKGDILIKFGKIYKVFKIKEKKIDGKPQKILFYRRLYPKNNREKISCSIPAANIAKTRIRRPFSKKQINDFLKLLKEKIILRKKIDINKIKTDIYSADLSEKADILKKLWLEKVDSDSKFSHSKKQLFSKLIETTTEEMAHVFGITPEKAEQKIQTALEKL